MSNFRARDVRLFRPYTDEVPWELLLEAGADEDVLRDALEQNLLRVGKHEGNVVGAYAVRPRTKTCFELVALAVDPAWRRKGIGRWLLGHAVGLAETKGAREIVAPSGGPGEGFLVRLGFAPAEGDLRLVLTPE